MNHALDDTGAVMLEDNLTIVNQLDHLAITLNTDLIHSTLEEPCEIVDDCSALGLVCLFHTRLLPLGL